MPRASNCNYNLQCKQESCINQSAYDELLSMWSHRKKINFTRAFVEAKKIDYFDCSKFRAYPAVVGIRTSHCVIAREKYLKGRPCGQSKDMTEDSLAKESLDERIFLSRAAIWRTWKIFPGKQQRITSLDKSEYWTYPTRPTEYTSDQGMWSQSRFFLKLNRHRPGRTEENLMLYHTTHKTVRNHLHFPKTW